MVLRVKGVPLLYLPVIYYPMQDDDRATGFLLPTYGTSTLRGQAISNGFFWAIDRSQDATFFHDWFTRRARASAASIATSPATSRRATSGSTGSRSNETTFTEDGVTTTLPATTASRSPARSTRR